MEQEGTVAKEGAGQVCTSRKRLRSFEALDKRLALSFREGKVTKRACSSSPVRSSMERSEHDRSVNTFSDQGRLCQVEYAIKAIQHGSTAIGVRTKEGVVLAVEKRLTSILLVPTSVEKVMEVDRHIGAAMSGLTADARTLIEKARIDAQMHRFTYDEPMKCESIAQAICDMALNFGEDKKEGGNPMSRPFGVALLLAGFDKTGASLYHTDPSGTYVHYEAKAIGSGSEGAQKSLEDAWHANMTLLEAQKLALEILKQVMEEKISSTNVEVATVTASGYKVLNKTELAAAVSQL